MFITNNCITTEYMMCSYFAVPMHICWMETYSYDALGWLTGKACGLCVVSNTKRVICLMRIHQIYLSWWHG